MDEVLVKVVGASQRLNFETGELQSFASIRFLDRVHELPISLKEFELLFRNRTEESAEEPAEEPEDGFGAYSEESEEEALRTDMVVHWPTLPDAALSPQLKRAMLMLQVPQDLPASELSGLVENIKAEFTEGDWLEVNKAFESKHREEAAVLPPSPPTPPQPALGQVTWTDGSPIMPMVKAARTVPSDEYGYPVTNVGVDPSAMIGAGDDVDEDGVGQL